MRNRAKCRKCQSIIESFHKNDYVSCKCGCIAISGGNYSLDVFVDDFDDLLRVDDLGNEIEIKVIVKAEDAVHGINQDLQCDKAKSQEAKKLTRKESIETLVQMINHSENLPENCMTLPISHYDFYSSMLIIVSIIKSLDESIS